MLAYGAQGKVGVVRFIPEEDIVIFVDHRFSIITSLLSYCMFSPDVTPASMAPAFYYKKLPRVNLFETGLGFPYSFFVITHSPKRSRKRDNVVCLSLALAKYFIHFQEITIALMRTG